MIVYYHGGGCGAIVSVAGSTGHAHGCTLSRDALVEVGVVPGTVVGGLTVVGVGKDGETLLTGDGLPAYGLRGWCDHGGDIGAPSSGTYYQIVGGLRDGRHGWVHSDPGCRRIVQTG